MKQEMSKLCQRVLKLAEQTGADECKVGLSQTKQADITYREQKPETVTEALTRSLTLEIYVNRRYSLQTTCDLRPKALEDFCGQAAANAKLLAADPYRSLPDPACYRGRAAVDLKTDDPAYDRVSPEKRHELAGSIEAACLREGGDKLVSAAAGLRDRRHEFLSLSSNGFEGYSRETGFLASALASVRDQDGRRPQSYYYNHVRRHQDLDAAAEVGRVAARRALRMLGAKKIKTETLPVIVENLVMGRLLKGLQAALSAQNIQQKQSFLADKKGQKIGGGLFTLIDDPLVPGGFGSRLFDEDGLAARRRTLFEAGVLKDFYVDWYYGRKLGWTPNGGYAGNLILPPGTRSIAEIMRDLGRGVLITEFVGGNVNAVTGDFSFGIGGVLFENGAPAQPVAEMNLADNHLRFWSKLTEAADDPWPHNEWRIPSLVFEGVTVAGI